MRATVEARCPANSFDKTFTTDAAGDLAIASMPFGIYQLHIALAPFAPIDETLAIRSAIPQQQQIHLSLAAVRTQVEVSAASALIDPTQASSPVQIGARQIQQRFSSLPGRSIQDLIVNQPGWLYEGNAVLHPRGSEYQTQFVIDGVPLIDNRSPSMGPEIEADDLESMSIYTAGIPAEYGRKMGGVIELNTRRQTDPGLHGSVILSGGTYDTRSAYGALQDTRGRNTFAATASGSGTSHYLNPVVPENFTNNGTAADFSARYEHDLPDADSINLTLRHELARFQVPNELIQQQAGQIQNGDNFETMAMLNYQHIASANSVIDIDAMARRNRDDLVSNIRPTPIAAFQHNHFDEIYAKGSYARHYRNQEWKAGVESDALSLHEAFQYNITDPTQFDPGTPPSLTFAAQRPDLEQAAFLQDQLHWGNWTASLGLRWDHYQLLLNQNALSPRVSLARYFSKAGLILHASYDRVFQTPAFDNILISSSPQVDALSSNFLRLPVQPERANYYELGATKAIDGHGRLAVNVYRRQATNFADDNQLLNTDASYPIAFHKAIIYGAEGKLDLVGVPRLNGFLSYSYMVGNVWLPVTGGLFLGQDATNALNQIQGHFPSTQDQRNTASANLRYKLFPRASVSSAAAYGSGLPFDYGGTPAQALAQYGPAVVSRLNFDRGRIRPTLALDASFALDAVKREHLTMTLRVDGENLNNRLNVLDFGGLFSGNAIAPARSVLARWQTSF